VRRRWALLNPITVELAIAGAAAIAPRRSRTGLTVSVYNSSLTSFFAALARLLRHCS
jgi:hypothetical protein